MRVTGDAATKEQQDSCDRCAGVPCTCWCGGDQLSWLYMLRVSLHVLWLNYQVVGGAVTLAG
jgi:hypothetical protein